MRGFKDKLLLISTVLLVIGVISLILENTFYQYVDEDGLVHESLFLPFGRFSVLLGGFGILLTIMFKVWAYKKESMGNKLLLISTVLLVIGVISLILENTFYQYVDEDGLVHESLFLPFGTFSVLLGGFGILLTIMFKVWAYKKESMGNKPKVYLAAINLLALTIYRILLLISTVLLAIGISSLIFENTLYELGGFGILLTIMFKVWAYIKGKYGE